MKFNKIVILVTGGVLSIGSSSLIFAQQCIKEVDIQRAFQMLVSPRFQLEKRNADPWVARAQLYKNHVEKGGPLTTPYETYKKQCIQELNSRDGTIFGASLDTVGNGFKKRYYNLNLLEQGSSFLVSSLDISSCPSPGKVYFTASYQDWEYVGAYRISKCHTVIRFYCDKDGNPYNDDGTPNLAYSGDCGNFKPSIDPAKIDCSSSNYSDNPICDIVTSDEKSSLTTEFNSQKIDFTVPVFDYALNSQNPTRECSLGSIKYSVKTLIDCNNATSEDEKYFCDSGCKVDSCFNQAYFKIDPDYIKSKLSNISSTQNYFTNIAAGIPLSFTVNQKTTQSNGSTDVYSCNFDVLVTKETAEIKTVVCNKSSNNSPETVYIKDVTEFLAKYTDTENNCK